MERILQQAKLFFATDERRLPTAAPGTLRSIRLHTNGTPDGNRRGLSPERMLAQRLEVDRVAQHAVRRVTHDYRPRLCDRLKPGGGIDEIAHDETLFWRGRSNRCLTGQHSDPEGKILAVQLVANTGDHVGQLQPGPDGSLCIVLMGDGRSPNRHDGVPDELLDSTAEPRNDVTGAVEVCGQRSSNDLGVSCLRERSESDEVGKEHCNEPAFVRISVEPAIPVACLLRLSCIERPAALTTEPIGGVVGCSTPRANEAERMATITTEPASWLVVDPAIGAHHRASSSSAAISRLTLARHRRLDAGDDPLALGNRRDGQPLSAMTLQHFAPSAVRRPVTPIMMAIMPVTNPGTRIPVFRRVPVFRGLHKATLFEVARRAAEVTYPAGATVVRQGDPGDALCIVAKGTVEVSRDDRVVTQLTAGDYFGEVSLIDGQPRSATVVAVDDVVLLELSSSDFDSLLSVPTVARVMMKNLARLIREAHDSHGPQCL